MSPAHPDAGYGDTRAFYLAYGFRPLEEFPTLWDPANPALQLIKTGRVKLTTRSPGPGGPGCVPLAGAAGAGPPAGSAATSLGIR